MKESYFDKKIRNVETTIRSKLLIKTQLIDLLSKNYFSAT